MIDQEAAPDSILNLDRCKCKTDCPSNCSCRKHGLNCVAACTNYHGDDCFNASAVESNDTYKDDSIMKMTNLRKNLRILRKPMNIKNHFMTVMLTELWKKP